MIRDIAFQGKFRVVESNRYRTAIKPGLRTEWREYQVRRGRHIVSRHETFRAAWDDAKQLEDARCEAELAKQRRR